MPENLDKRLIISNLMVARTICYYDENKAPYPAERDDCGSPLEHDKFRQIFPNFHHRDHGTLSHILRTHELHPDGEVQPLM